MKAHRIPPSPLEPAASPAMVLVLRPEEVEQLAEVLALAEWAAKDLQNEGPVDMTYTEPAIEKLQDRITIAQIGAFALQLHKAIAL